jgi:hypothetical protein
MRNVVVDCALGAELNAQLEQLRVAAAACLKAAAMIDAEDIVELALTHRSDVVIGRLAMAMDLISVAAARLGVTQAVANSEIRCNEDALLTEEDLQRVGLVAVQMNENGDGFGPVGNA